MVMALRDALIARDELVGEAITEVIERAISGRDASHGPTGRAPSDAAARRPGPLASMRPAGMGPSPPWVDWMRRPNSTPGDRHDHAFRHRRRRPHADREVRRGVQGPARPSTSARPPSARRSPARASTAATIDYVIMGQVLQAGAGQITARQAAIAAGIPKEVPAITHQQGVPVGPERHRAGRPAHPGRRDRDRGRRRHGVDDERARTCCRRRGSGPAWGTPTSSTRWSTTGCGRRSPTSTWASPPTRSTPSSGSRARTRTPGRRGRTSARPRRGRPGAFAEEVVAGRGPAAQGRPGGRRPRRGHPRRHHRRVARASCGRRSRTDGHDHGGERLADLRRRGRDGRDERGEGRGARHRAARRDRRARHVRRALRLPPHRPGHRHAARAEEGRHGRPRPRAARDQRGVRLGRAERHADARRRRGDRERERRRGRARAPDRRDRRAAGADAGATRCAGAAWSSAAPRCAAAAARATR